MNAQRLAGLIALLAGASLVITLVVAAIVGPAALGSTRTTTAWPMRPAMMGNGGHADLGMRATVIVE